MCACGADSAADGLALVAAEIVHDDDVAWLEGWHQDLGDVGQEAVGIDRAIEEAWRGDAVAAQSGDEGHGVPVSVRRLADQALAAPAATVGGGHVGLGPGLVDEDQAVRGDLVLVAPPALAPARHVGPILLGGAQAFF